MIRMFDVTPNNSFKVGEKLFYLSGRQVHILTGIHGSATGELSVNNRQTTIEKIEKMVKRECEKRRFTYRRIHIYPCYPTECQKVNQHDRKIRIVGLHNKPTWVYEWVYEIDNAKKHCVVLSSYDDWFTTQQLHNKLYAGRLSFT